MNINQVKYFVTVYEQGSISTAARGHNVSAQAVSKAISDLEREYGQKLFDRTNSGVNPTVQGRAFYQKAKVAARAYTDLETMSFGGGLPEPESLAPFRMALCSPAFDGDDELRRAWSMFFQRNTGMPITFDLASREQMARGIDPDEYDALVTIGTYERQGCTCTPMGSLPTGITVARTHPLASKEFVTFADLGKYPAGESGVYDSFNSSILVTCKQLHLVSNVNQITTAADALAHITIKQGYYFSVVLNRLRKAKLATALIPIDPAEDPRIPICIVTRDDRETARHRIVRNFALHAMDLVGS
ncbi:LysR family transcriptional regulator [Senegalimassilia anaerobia]|uniref:LysR family transcriptional regulator n=1 Tax=Senegalimassilia anaerobia TaxID=1473216 RepID=UPI0026F2769D|nr:LysR family transcriptional regulator [Senegalimassilia anaerobia]